MRTNPDNSKSVITRKDLQIELAPIKADLNLVKWMLGALIAIAIAGFSKQFL
jgi:phosphate starvation-inducible protein PhoH